MLSEFVYATVQLGRGGDWKGMRTRWHAKTLSGCNLELRNGRSTGLETKRHSRRKESLAPTDSGRCVYRFQPHAGWGYIKNLSSRFEGDNLSSLQTILRRVIPLAAKDEPR